MKSRSAFRRPTPAMILAAKPTVAEMKKRRRREIYVVFDSVRSRYNVGAMFRTSDAALVKKIFLAGITPQPPHKEIDKSALGASDVVPWEYVKSAVEVVKKLKKEGVQIVALELTQESLAYDEADYTLPMCLVVGGEVDGVSEELLSLADFAVAIPMSGRAHSLNVSTAYGIALFEILKQSKARK